MRAGTHYPAMYIVTADHDVRVATTAGHGGATTKAARVDNDAELLAFFTQYLAAR